MAEVIARRSLELVDPKTNADKFYEILLWRGGEGEEHAVEIHFGRHGTKGSNTLNRHASWYSAQDEFYKRVEEKTGKGYVPKVDDNIIQAKAAPPSAAPPPPSKEELAQDFVRLLAENRDK